MITKQQEDMESTDVLVARVRKTTWPAGHAIMNAAIEKMQKEMEKTVHTDTAFNLVTVMLLNEVFMRRTILAAAGRCDEDVLQWIEEEYDAWNDGADEAAAA